MIFTANTLHSADGLDTSLTSPNVVFRVDQKRVNILAHITRTYLLLHFEWAGDTFLRDQSKHQINIHCTQNLLCRLYCRRGSNSEPMTRKYAKYVYVYTFKDESMCLWRYLCNLNMHFEMHFYPKYLDFWDGGMCIFLFAFLTSFLWRFPQIQIFGWNMFCTAQFQAQNCWMHETLSCCWKSIFQ